MSPHTARVRSSLLSIAVPATVALVAFASTSTATAQLPFPGVQPGTQIGDGLPAGDEPSGAVWHSRLNQLFVVDDSGRLSSMDADGSSVRSWSVGGDLEGVCVADPATSNVYVGREHPDAVLEFDLTTGSVVRTFDLTAHMIGADNRGLEALTFVPDPAHPEGGTFYAGLQETGEIFVFDLPIRSSTVSTSVALDGTIPPPAERDDISGLDFHRPTGTLYAIYDNFDLVRATDADGTTLIGEWMLPGNDQEGIAIDACNRLFVAHDAGTEVWVYGAFPNAVPASSTSYGTGHAGTLGVPALTLSAQPRLGAVSDLRIGNSRGASTPAVLFLGTARASVPTQFGGSILVSPILATVSLGLGAATTTIPLSFTNPNLCGFSFHFQVVEIDPGASAGISFSRGLEFTIGG